MHILSASALSIITFFSAVINAQQADSLVGKVLTSSNLTDSLYKSPYFDTDEWRDTPVRHRYMHGGFNGTQLRFSYYFPSKELFKHRFFQGLPAVPGNEKVALQPASLGAIIGGIVPFSFETGGYVVESNQGSESMAGGDDMTIVGYRGSAATAQLSRIVAERIYGSSAKIYGYVFGGSGGGYKTTACIENTEVWDGAVPFIIGSPVSIPNVFTVQAHAMRLLDGKFGGIVDALEPGGSGDMYAGLNQEQKEALLEVTKMGFPPPAWYRIKKIAAGYTGVFASLLDTVLIVDKAYFTDFWTKDGYLGKNPPASLLNAKILHNTTVKRVIMTNEAVAMGLPVSISGRFAEGLNESPAAFELLSVPKGNALGATITLTSGASKDAYVYISNVVNTTAVIGFGVYGAKTIAKLRPNDQVTIDNTNYLASQTYHRHQDPGPEYPVWDQFKVNGKPKYPIRPIELSNLPLSGTGTRQSGKFKGTSSKVIVIESGWDEAAFPWQADWYRKQVIKNYGAKTDDVFRLWMVDKCMHTSPSILEAGEERPAETTRMVSYTPIIQQALRDLTKWVEKGVPPPPTTNYSIDDGQLVLPSTASARSGIQPVVTLVTGGKDHATVRVGQAVQFSGTVSVPRGTGVVVGTEFDFEGDGKFPVQAKFNANNAKDEATVTTTYTFKKAGTYFPALQGIAQRDGGESPFGRVTNLGRVRIVVT
jgi:hypothetical protein